MCKNSGVSQNDVSIGVIRHNLSETAELKAIMAQSQQVLKKACEQFHQQMMMKQQQKSMYQQ